MREEGSDANHLMNRLIEEPMFKEAGITPVMLSMVLTERGRFIGNADHQISMVQKKAETIIEKYSKEADYEPGDIL